MNWLFFAVVALIGYHIIDGLRKGFIRKAVSMVTIILTLILVTFLTPTVSKIIREHTTLKETLQENCSKLILDEALDENIKSNQVMMIENLKLPENIKDMILENNNDEVYKLLDVEQFHEYVGAYLADLIITALAYVVTFVVVWVLLRIALIAMDVVAKLPILYGINGLAGGVLGLAEGIVLVWISFLLVTVFGSDEVGTRFFAMIGENQLLQTLYQNNMIMGILFGMIV